jgi:hypothetical protein
MIMMERKVRIVLVGAALAWFGRPLPAALLVYEPFNYGLSTGDTLADTVVEAAGLQGNYVVTNRSSEDQNGEASFRSEGIDLGATNFPPQNGGALQFKASAEGTAKTSSSKAEAALKVSPAKGSLYVSYLVNFSEISRNDASGVVCRVVDRDAGGNSSNLRLQAAAESFSNGGRATSRPAVALGAKLQDFEGAWHYLPRVTYLVLARFERVGEPLSAEAPGAAELWIFDAQKFDAWHDAGALAERLGEFSLAHIKQSQASGMFSLGDPAWIQWMVSSGNNGAPTNLAVTVDELRIGTELKDVISQAP